MIMGSTNPLLIYYRMKCIVIQTFHVMVTYLHTLQSRMHMLQVTIQNKLLSIPYWTTKVVSNLFDIQWLGYPTEMNEVV